MIMPSLITYRLLTAFGLCFTSFLQAQPTQQIDVPYAAIGQITPKHARDITASPWSVGGETLDRDFASYDNYKKYLGPLGVKMIRLQTGWAKTEQQPGVYDFRWLDPIVANAVSQGVKPWLQLSYGNPAYTGGGDAGLGGGIPTSKEALAAWDRWVAAMVVRYRDQTDVWEIWNESDLERAEVSAEAYADLYVRTAEIVRDLQPEAHLYALAIAHIDHTDYPESFLKRLQEKDKLHLLDEITYHGYKMRPEDSYPLAEKFKQVVAQYVDGVTLRQGEQGAPSTNISRFALNNHDWTEVSQTKWILRRMLGDIGHGVPSLVFTMTDLRYLLGENGQDTVLNTKGLLATDYDLNVLRPKASYYAVQHLASVIDQPVTRVDDFALKSETGEEITAHAFRKEDGSPVVALWFPSDIPSNTLKPQAVTLTLSGVHFNEPVYIDLLSGKVYEIPKTDWQLNSDGTMRFTQLPVLDLPVLITEKTTVLP
jgi:hypothetical protein